MKIKLICSIVIRGIIYKVQSIGAQFALYCTCDKGIEDMRQCALINKSITTRILLKYSKYGSRTHLSRETVSVPRYITI